jgi:hypothetical protein
MDKAFWKQLAENEYQVPEGYDLLDLTEELLGYLGSPDPELRDEIAYRTFHQWMNKQKVYTPEILRSIRDILIDNLFVGLRQDDKDTVLLRSFSALVLSLIVYYDVQDAFLEQDEFDDMLDAVLRYFEAEYDLRGYDPKVGWVHALAHAADLLKFMVRNKKTEDENHEFILQSIANKLLASTDTVFVHDEDERLALAALEIIRRGEMEFEAIVAILHQFEAWKKHNMSPEFDPKLFATHQNIKHFLRSWYFQVTKIETENLPEDYREGLVGFLERATRAYNF